MTQPIQNSDIAKSFEKLVDSTFMKIDGCLVKRGINEHTGQEGLIWLDEWFENEADVRNAMKGIYGQISLSIMNSNGGVKKLGDEYADCYRNGESGWGKYKNDQAV
jgi:hypothetical protein